MATGKRMKNHGVIWIKGSVSTELQEGKPVAVEGALIKTSLGAATYTDKKGNFSCPVCAEYKDYALCAQKNGFQLWVDWKKLDREGLANEWDIVLTPGPEGSDCSLHNMTKLSVTGVGCVMPVVINAATLKPIPGAWIKLDGQNWVQTDTSGNSRCLCGSAGPRLLWAKKLPKFPAQSKGVDLPLGATLVPANASDPQDRGVIALQPC